ncbi:hypothetical protein [Myxococcus xanthus]|nr:hypothetical protein [Myxococcus xanthus]
MSKRPEDQVVMSLYEGVIMVELSGRLSDAEATFKAALFLNPAAKLPLLVSPKLKQHFESVRQDVLSELAARGVAREPLKMEAPTEAQRVQAPRGPLPAVAGSHSALRDRALIPAVAGGALVVTAGVFWGLAEGKKSKLAHKAQHIGSQAEARNLASSARGLQTVSVGLLVGGLVGLGAATGMYLLGSPEEQGSLQFGTNGSSAFVSGRWP